MELRKKRKIDQTELISATGIVNYIRSDCIIDYLDIVDKNDYMIDESDLQLKKKQKKEELDKKDVKNNKIRSVLKRNKIKKRNKSGKLRKRELRSSFDYIVDDGYKFESDIFDKIKEKMISNNELNKLKEIKEKDLNKNYNQTINILKEKNHDIILGGILVNEKDNTYGYPDMIVLGKWIIKYIESVPSCVNENDYYIIDIKSSTINLISNGDHVSSGLLFNGYKSQIYVYTEALKSITGSKIDVGFILGKRYQYLSVGKKINIENPFGRLGIINFSHEKEIGNNLENKVNEAIKWKKEVKENWKDFKLNPIDNTKLYPNIKNTYDKHHHKIKKRIAYINKEITLLWNCGLKNREISWSNGIKRFDDPNLIPEKLGIEKKSSKYVIIDKMLKINRSTDQIITLNRSNNYKEWQTQKDHEFFVDFETYYDQDFIDQEENNNFNISNQKLYMIGVNYISNVDRKNKFVCFVLKYKNNIKSQEKKEEDIEKIYIYCENQLDLINKFVEFIDSFNTNLNKLKYYEKIRLIHWSCAEPVVFTKVLQDLQIPKTDLKYKLPWYDLMEIFKNNENPILIKDCFGFGLKEVIRSLDKLGKINLKWPELDDGLLSSFIARDIYRLGDSSNNSESDNKMNLIIDYNYVDCHSLNVLLDWMRSYI